MQPRPCKRDFLRDPRRKWGLPPKLSPTAGSLRSDGRSRSKAHFATLRSGLAPASVLKFTCSSEIGECAAMHDGSCLGAHAHDLPLLGPVSVVVVSLVVICVEIRVAVGSKRRR